MGFVSVFDITNIFIVMVCQIVFGIFSNYLSNMLIMTEELPANYLIFAIIIGSIKNTESRVIEHFSSARTNNERIIISSRITNWLDQQIINASAKWKRENPYMTQKDIIDTIFHTYFNITCSITYIIKSSITTFCFFATAFFNSWTICAISIIGNYLLYHLRNKFSTELDKIDKKMAARSKERNIEISETHTKRFENIVNPLYKQQSSPNSSDIVNSISKSVALWDGRNTLSNKTQLITEFVKAIFTLIFAFIYFNNQKMVLWIMLNNSQLFGIIDIITKLDQIKNLNASRLAIHLITFDQLVDKKKDYKVQKTFDKNFKLFKIEIDKIRQELDNGVVLESLTPITLHFNQKTQIVLLDGEKGCGKSLTMDILAGLYDESVCKNMFINNKKSTNEFRDIQNLRIYIEQLIADRYRQNRINSITMTLDQLFPDATLDELTNYLKHFDLTKKIPQTEDPLHTRLGQNERSFSPGELQAMIMASQLYRVRKLDVPLLLLDEPERNIDYRTVKNIFNNIITKLSCTIVLITHNDTLKEYLRERGLVSQEWKFESKDKHLQFRVQRV